MKLTKSYPASPFNRLAIQFFRFVMKNCLPPSLFREKLPLESERNAKVGHLSLEIVSHCWNYANTLTYQLSSFVNNPPKKLTVTVTVFYSPEDTKTQATLKYFEAIDVPNVIWNFYPMKKEKVFRRGIGRNMAAQSTSADWLWFTDCDIIFHANCLDSLAEQLQGKTGSLYYPHFEFTTDMLASSDPMLQDKSEPQVVDIDAKNFTKHFRDKAKGAFQIVHGDVARAIGYCDKLKMFQTESERWRKTFEDTAFKWLIKSEGVPIDIDGVFQIRHITKGRYKENSNISVVRSKIRRIQE